MGWKAIPAEKPRKNLECIAYKSEGKGEKLRQIEEFRIALKTLHKIKNYLEKKGYILKRLSDKDLENEIERYIKGKSYGVLEYFYYGPSHSIKWKIGVSLMVKKLRFHYEKISPDIEYEFDDPLSFETIIKRNL